MEAEIVRLLGVTVTDEEALFEAVVQIGHEGADLQRRAAHVHSCDHPQNTDRASSASASRRAGGDHLGARGSDPAETGSAPAPEPMCPDRGEQRHRPDESSAMAVRGSEVPLGDCEDEQRPSGVEGGKAERRADIARGANRAESDNATRPHQRGDSKRAAVTVSPRSEVQGTGSTRMTVRPREGGSRRATWIGNGLGSRPPCPPRPPRPLRPGRPADRVRIPRLGVLNADLGGVPLHDEVDAAETGTGYPGDHERDGGHDADRRLVVLGAENGL